MEGTTISHFRILAKIGEGGMGVVYKAEDEKLGRPVALKILPAGLTGDEERRLRLIREARTAAAVNHPNIAAIYEIDEVGGVTFVAMEYIDGRNLRARLGGSSLEIKEALKIAAGIAEGLARAHQGRIVHRDLKPENVMMTADGHVKILDFGLAKLLETHTEATPSEMSRLETISAEQTREGTIVGTTAYMSPEQARGQTLDSRSDLFSFGIVLYEMITGKTPFKGSTKMDTLTAIIRETPPPAIDLNPDIPPELQRIVTKCLEKDPAERYQDTRDLAVDLKHLIRDTDSQSRRRPEVSGVTVPAGRRVLPRVATYLAVGAVIVGAGLGWLAWQRSRTQRQTPVRPEVTLRQLTANPAENYVYDAAISPDGKYLAYYDDERGVHLLSIGTGETRDLPITDADWGDELSWFPDGTRLVLTKSPVPKDSIWAYSIMTGIGRKLREDACEPSVSPDGSLIAFRVDHGIQEIGIMKADGAAARTIARAEEGETINLWNPVWSPSGRRIAWLAGHLSKGDAIESADLEGKQRTVILSDPELSSLTAHRWLRDGRILFVQDASDPTTRKSVLWEIAVNPLSGRVEGPPRQITSSTGSNWEALSATADGQRVALVDIPWQLDVHVGDLEANGTRLTEPRRLTNDDRDDYVSGWSRDSRSVLFASPRRGTLDIFKQDPDGSTAETVFASSDEEWGARVTPDGSSLLFWQRTDGDEPGSALRLMRFPLSGGAPETVFDPTGLYPDDTRWSFQCEATRCVLCEGQLGGKQLVFFDLDPVEGKGRELARMDSEGRAWALSADGVRIAVQERVDRILVMSLPDSTTRTIPLNELDTVGSAAWSHDGRHLFLAGFTGTSWTVLSVSMHGETHVLSPQGLVVYGAVPSPDGRHLALRVGSGAGNAWLIENF